jgi:hypothetical protein
MAKVSKKAPLSAADEAARVLLDGLSPAQLDEVGTMLGMSNMGLHRLDRPEALAESDEMYDGMMEEICSWRRQLRDRKERWGWLADLSELAAEARRRRPQR